MCLNQQVMKKYQANILIALGMALFVYCSFKCNHDVDSMWEHTNDHYHYRP